MSRAAVLVGVALATAVSVYAGEAGPGTDLEGTEIVAAMSTLAGTYDLQPGNRPGCPDRYVLFVNLLPEWLDFDLRAQSRFVHPDGHADNTFETKKSWDDSHSDAKILYGLIDDTEIPYLQIRTKEWWKGSLIDADAWRVREKVELRFVGSLDGKTLTVSSEVRHFCLGSRHPVRSKRSWKMFDTQSTTATCTYQRL